MVLDQKLTKKMLDMIKKRPRTIQEISVEIKKNWRTAERYVDRIKQETGQISWKVFREGTRAALKIVYWNIIEDIHSTTYQEELFEDIMHGRWYFDFSPFNIYQHISDKKRNVLIDKSKDPELNISEEQDLKNYLRKATKQVLIFSGNLSWVNGKQGDVQMIDILKELVERNVSIKIIARISFVGMHNSEKVLSLNKSVGKDLIEIKNKYQPLRAIIIDDKVVRFREIKNPDFYEHEELKEKITFFYDIYDKDWIEWLQKVFWKMYANALPAEKRIKEMDNLMKKI